jgi:biotin carboxylase
VPVVPGSDGLIDDVEQGLRAAKDVGYPVLIKASAGGGGRGIRVAHDDEELAAGISAAQQEAEAAFGDGSVYLERLVPRARHIEVQVLGDGTDAVHFFERDCSLQRRRQKIWEEAPATVLGEEVRQRICDTAVDLAKSVGYRGAGTVEFLYDPANEGGPGVRIDSMACPGYTIPPFYDSLIGNLIVWAEDRDLALARLRRALGEIELVGPKTTLPFFETLLEQDDVVGNDFHTTWIETWQEEKTS